MALQSPQYPADVQEAPPQRGNVRSADLIVPGAWRGIAEDRSTVARTQHGKPFLGSNDMVKVTNIDTCAWRFEWDRRKYDVKKGATMQVPFPAVVNLMGDPRSMEGAEITFRTETGERGVIQSRYDSLLMLMSRYGVRDENVQALIDFAPKLEITTLDGDPIAFPAQNPKHIAWPTPQAPEPGREQPTDMRQLVERYEADKAEDRAQINELHGLVNELLAARGDAPQGTPDPRQPVAASAAAEALLAGVAEDPAEAPLGGAVADTGPRSQV